MREIPKLSKNIVKSSYYYQNIISSCVNSFIALESYINKYHYELFINADSGYYNVKTPRAIMEYFRGNWKRISIRDKYILIAAIIADYEFDTKKKPFVLFDEFIKFRNLLIHPPMLEIISKIEITNIDEILSGGIVIEEYVNKKKPKKLFPHTKFSERPDKLTITDAEKAFEISYRMIMDIYNISDKTHPLILHYSENGKDIIYKIGESIIELINPHFGKL